MLCGDTGVFKRDRHIINFFHDYLKVKDTTYDNLCLEFIKQLDVIKSSYTGYNIRALDGVIWQFMSSKK